MELIFTESLMVISKKKKKKNSKNFLKKKNFPQIPIMELNSKKKKK